MKQNELVNYLKDKFKNIEGVRALFLKGSLARNQGDEFSDVDFYCLVDEDKYESVKALRDEKLKGYNEIYFREEVNFGLEQIIVLYSNNLHLDFYLTKDIPTTGNDDVKAVYDPDSILSDYTRKKRIDSKDDVVESINQSIYTFSEVDAAIRRGDKLWAMRLLSHILAILSTPLSHLFDKGNPVVHMKGLYKKLPIDFAEDIDVVMELMIPDTQVECTKKLIQLNEKIIDLLDDELRKKLSIKYLKLIKKVINDIPTN